MTTVTVTGQNGATVNASSASPAFIINENINLLTAQNTKGSALATGDVINAIAIPAGYAVDFVAVNVTTAVTGASAFPVSVGDGTTAALWASAAAATTAGYLAGTPGAASTAFSTSGGYIVLTLGTVTGTLTAGVLNITVSLIKVGANGNAGTPTF